MHAGVQASGVAADVVGFVLIAGACGCLLASLVALVQLGRAVTLRRLVRRLAAVPQLTCAQVAGRAGPQALCATTGTAGPGPAGTHTAPFSGIECVWYRTVVRRRYKEYENGRGSGRSEVVHDDGVMEPFTVSDASGVVLVQTHGDAVREVEQTVSRRQPEFQGRTDGTFELAEWVIRAGDRILVAGQAVVDPRTGGASLVPPLSDEHDMVVSGGDRDDFTERGRRRVRSTVAAGTVTLAVSAAWIGALVWFLATTSP